LCSSLSLPQSNFISSTPSQRPSFLLIGKVLMAGPPTRQHSPRPGDLWGLGGTACGESLVQKSGYYKLRRCPGPRFAERTDLKILPNGRNCGEPHLPPLRRSWGGGQTEGDILSTTTSVGNHSTQPTTQAKPQSGRSRPITLDITMAQLTNDAISTINSQ
jgi:hypothetical protein